MADTFDIRREIGRLSTSPALTASLLDAFERRLTLEMYRRITRLSDAELDVLITRPNDPISAARLRAFTEAASTINKENTNGK